MRDEGTVFLSFGGKFLVTDDTMEETSEQSLYVEYGASKTITIGLTGTLIPGPEGIVSLDTKGDAQVFLRFPLDAEQDGPKMSMEFGLGGQYQDDTVEGFIKAGVSWGQGIRVQDRSGWVNIDASVHLPLGALEQAFKLDATVGLSLSDRFQIMAQGFGEADRFGRSVTLAPSLVYSATKSKTKYVGSFERRVGRLAGRAVKISVWREF